MIDDDALLSFYKKIASNQRGKGTGETIPENPLKQETGLAGQNAFFYF